MFSNAASRYLERFGASARPDSDEHISTGALSLAATPRALEQERRLINTVHVNAVSRGFMKGQNELLLVGFDLGQGCWAVSGSFLSQP